MIRARYTAARRYATRIKYTDPLDLVHDAYIRWYDKTGKDLFDEPEHLVMRMVYWEFKRWMKENNWTYNKEPQGKRLEFPLFSHEETMFLSPYGDSFERLAASRRTFNPVTPLDHCLANETEELYQRFIEESSEVGGKILELRREGFNNVEIAKKFNKAKSWVSYQLKQIV